MGFDHNINIVCATGLLLTGHITSTEWMAITGLGGGLVGIKGAIKAAKSNGNGAAVAPVKP